MENKGHGDVHDEVRALMLSAQMELPAYADDPIVQRRLGNILSDASCRLFARLNARRPYPV